MKPAVVAQDEMFPDGDAGWMEMDEVSILICENYCINTVPVFFMKFYPWYFASTVVHIF